VVIPVRNERAAIEACLASVLAQSEPALQVLVVDGRSDDGTPDVVRRVAERDPRVELLENPDRVVPHALNRALDAARAPWLVRVDGHAEIQPGYVARAVEHLRTGRYAGVGGVKRSVGRTAAGRAIAVAMSSRLGVGGSYYHYGTEPREVEHVPFGCYAVDVARELGGWDETLVVNQDFEFDHRLRKAGHRLLFDPQLVIDWECRQSVRDLFRQYRRYGRGKVKVALLHPDSVRVRHLLPPALVAVLAGAAAVSLVQPAALVVVLGYPTALAIAALGTGRAELAGRERLFLPAAFAAMHVGWGVGFWQGLLRDRGRATAAVVATSARPAG